MPIPPITVEQVTEEDISIQNAVETIHTYNHRYNVETPFKITTMTLVVNLCENIQIDPNQFMEWVQLQPTETPLFPCISHWSVKSGFLNSIIFKLLERESGYKISIKLFRNGKLHMTGVKTCQHAMTYANRFVEMIKSYLDIDITLSTIQKQLTNGCTKVNLPNQHKFNLSQLYDIMLQDDSLEPHMCIFNNDHYPGIRIKYGFQSPRHTTTIMIFESGSILFVSFLSATQLTEVYHFVLQFMGRKECLDTIGQNPDRKLKLKRQKFDYSEFLM
jgi:TATA-box binding protein (TBP) (component of TFIID and TFIIIB)